MRYAIVAAVALIAGSCATETFEGMPLFGRVQEVSPPIFVRPLRSFVRSDPYIGKFMRLTLSAAAKFISITSPTVPPLVSTTSFAVLEASGNSMVKELLVRPVLSDTNWSNQSMKPTAPLRNEL
jgi:hypothetical protein